MTVGEFVKSGKMEVGQYIRFANKKDGDGILIGNATPHIEDGIIVKAGSWDRDDPREIDSVCIVPFQEWSRSPMSSYLWLDKPVK